MISVTARKIHLVEIDSTLEAQAIRACGEALGYTVGVTWTGNSQQVVEALGCRPGVELIFLCAHGEEGRVLLPELAEELKPNYPFADSLRASDFNEFLNLKGGHVVNLACTCGTKEMANAFLKQGAESYVGATDYVEGDAALLYAVNLLYAYKLSSDFASAHQQATQSADDDRRLFQLER